MQNRAVLNRILKENNSLYCFDTWKNERERETYTNISYTLWKFHEGDFIACRDFTIQEWFLETTHEDLNQI